MSAQASMSPIDVSEEGTHCDPTAPKQSATGDEQCSVRLRYVVVRSENRSLLQYPVNSPWWFASEVCPLLAGTLGPLATGFSACSLTAD